VVTPAIYAEAGIAPAPLAFTVTAQAKAGGAVRLDLFDIVGRDLFGEGISAALVAGSLPESAKDVTVRINSPGGVASEGHAIRSVLRAHAADTGGKITVEIHGLAASAATIIAMAGDEIKIAADAQFMIHEAHGIAMGGADSFRSMADQIEAANENMAGVYARRTGKPVAEVRKLMAAETWMNADEAIKAGFADAALPESSDDTTKAVASERIFAALSDFDRTPADLAQRYRNDQGVALVAAMASPAPEPVETPQETRTMNEHSLSLLGLKADASETEITAAIAQLSVRAHVADALKAEAEEKAKAEAERADAEAKAKAFADVEHRIEALQTSGRKTPAQAEAMRAKWAARADKPDAAAAFLEDLAEAEACEPSPLVGRSELEGKAAPLAGDPNVLSEADRKLFADAGLALPDDILIATKRKFDEAERAQRIA